MINDGYSLAAGFDTRRFIYRPAMHWERKGVIQLLRSQPHKGLVDEFLSRKVVWSDVPLTGWRVEELEVLFRICLGTLAPQFGGDWEPNWELRDARNLWRGVVLEHWPAFAKRDCGACRKWWYDDDTGKVIERKGKPLLRPEDTVLLCETPAGCPRGTPDNQNKLSEKNQFAWRHYRECAAVGAFPNDPIVKTNALIIQKAIRHARRLKQAGS